MPLDDTKEFETLVRDLKVATDAVKKHAEDTNTELKNLGNVTAETKTAADNALIRMNELSARLDEAEKKLARRPGEDEDRRETRSLGQQVVENDEVKAFMASGGRARNVTVDVKVITSASGSGQVLVPADRQAGIVAPPLRRMTVRDLLTPGRTNSNSIEYVKELVWTNAAATVAENTLKPESNITFSLSTVNVRTLAHWVKASKQILADAPMLQSYIDGRLRYGLEFAEEAQLLNGDGTGANILGLIPQATAYVAPITLSGGTILDQIRLAMLQAALSEYPATGIVMHPSDWTRAELTKDSTGRYLFANPQGIAQPTLWRLPVVDTPAISQDKFLVGAFRLAAQIFDREDATVLISTEDQDNFVKNMVTVLCEERLALAVYRPAAIIYGDLGFIA